MGMKNWISVLFLAITLAILPVFITSSYHLSMLMFIGLYCLITMGLSLLMGYAGQISLGHAAFYGIGAYTSALLTTRWEMNPWLAMLIALILAGVLAMIVGIPTLKLTGHYLAMATLAFGVIVHIFFNAAIDLTGGPSGVGGIPYLKIGDWKLNSDKEFYYVVWGAAILALIISLNIIHSRVGRALRSIHGSEQASKAMGVNTAKYKNQVFILSACFAALAGSLYAHYMTFISPSSFDFKFSVMLVTMVAVGGMSNVWGAIVGTLLLFLLQNYLEVFEQYYLLIYGGILVVIMIFMPQGFLAGIKNVIVKIYSLFSGRREVEA